VWELLKRIGAVAGVVLALAGVSKLYVELGGPTLAWSQDVQRLESQQIDIAIDVYQQQERSLTLQKGEVERAGGTGTREDLYITEELNNARGALQQLRQRKIELSR
jgi:hypothetical protein